MSHPRGIAWIALLTALAAPAQAQMLQNCTLVGATGELPIGQPGDPGFAWKQDLYTWLQTLTPADFTFSPAPQFEGPVDAYGAALNANAWNCSFGNSVLPAPWPGVGPTERFHIEQWMILTRETMPVFWPMLGHDPAIYTLDEMENETTCNAMTPDLAWGNSLAWLVEWEYAGNPFRPGTWNNTALRNRLGAWLAMQLITLDWAQFGGTYTAGGMPSFPIAPYAGALYDHPLPGSNAYVESNGAELSAMLGMMAWMDRIIGPTLPGNVQGSVETALLTFAERVHLWNPYHSQTNRGIRAAPALFYVWDITGSPDVWSWYEDVLVQYFSDALGNWVNSGYWRDDYGFDLGYNGSNMMVGVRELAEDPSAPSWVYDTVARTFDLTSHLAVKDPDGLWTSPTVFNSRTPNGSTYASSWSPRVGYYGGIHRFLPALDMDLPFAHAMMRDYPLVGPQNPTAFDPNSADFQERIGCATNGFGFWITLAIGTPSPGLGQAVWPPLERSQDFGLPPTSVALHRPGALQDWWDDVQTASVDERMPIEFDGPYLRNFSDRFVTAKYGTPGQGDEEAAILHLGEVGVLGSGAESGFGGGQLVTYWSGAFGLRDPRASQGPERHDDRRERRLHPVALHPVAHRVPADQRGRPRDLGPDHRAEPPRPPRGSGAVRAGRHRRPAHARRLDEPAHRPRGPGHRRHRPRGRSHPRGRPQHEHGRLPADRADPPHRVQPLVRRERPEGVGQDTGGAE